MRDAAAFFKLLADESRLKMLWLLMNRGELCVCDVMAALGITQSKASRHLITLRHAGLLADRRDGLWSYYSLRPAADRLARRHLAALKADLAARPDACALLAALDEWLANKKRGAVCVAGAAKPARRAPPRQRSRTGGSR